MSYLDFATERSDDACDDDAPWTEDDVHFLVQLYREQPSLWDQECPSYVSYCDRRRAYECIQCQVKELGVSVLQVIMKLHEVRKLYVEELKNIAVAKMSGDCYESPYVWFWELDEFLHCCLHVDEIEELEEIENNSNDCFSSNYDIEDNYSTAVVYTRSLADVCQTTEAPKRSCTVSLPSIQSKSGSTSPKNCGDSNCPVNKCRAETAKSSTSSLKRLQSDPSGRSIAIVRSSSQPIKMRERDEEESSLQSRLTTRKSCDEFDQFAMSVACRLRRMSPGAAARAQTEIQRVLTNAARDTEPNAGRVASENVDNDSLSSSKYSVHDILSHSDSRQCDGQGSKESVNTVNKLIY